MLESMIRERPVLHLQEPRPGEKPRKILKMKRHERMAGSVPVWEEQKTMREGVQLNLTRAVQSRNPQFESAMAYADPGTGQAAVEEFGFGDLIDMVNPLQHVPLLNRVYREVTGDEIRPISKIVGGALYVGAAGAASGLADTIMEYETGKDMADNVLGLVKNGKTPDFRSAARRADHPERRLENAVNVVQHPDIPGNALSFVDLGGVRRQVYERVPVADGRTAGSMDKTYMQIVPPAPQRMPITQVTMSSLALLQDRK